MKVFLRIFSVLVLSSLLVFAVSCNGSNKTPEQSGAVGVAMVPVQAMQRSLPPSRRSWPAKMLSCLQMILLTCRRSIRQ